LCFDWALNDFITECAPVLNALTSLWNQLIVCSDYVTNNNWDLIIGKQIWVFHWFCFSRVEDCFEIALIKRVWNRIFICINFISFCNKCNPSALCVNSGVWGREVLCALEVVKISILGGVCAEPKEVCVLRGSRTLLSWCCK